MDQHAHLPAHLHDIRKRVEGYARECGLDPFDTIFEVLGFDEINMVAAYGGFPNRYPHWRFGMEYERLAKGYEYGLSKIYEMVINNDPSYAYLLESNADVDQKLVMAHVFGHADFFKHNFMFRHTNRKMMDQMANHATRVRRYQDKLGVEPVEDLIDRCLSLENLIDYQSPYVKRHDDPRPRGEPEERALARGFKTDREYMGEYSRSGSTSRPPGRRRSRSGRSGTCSCSCWSTRRWSAGSTTSSPSCARRPTTSPPRARPRS
jgi:stage V sporulation protein R